ncbi:restriction endonuclease [Patescibacteria group bacterium]|nr:restriction endonuclease [Patescibacteria group bacterium]
MKVMVRNFLYYGDNLDILRRYIRDETVDLVYLDPPFNSNATYNVLFAEQNGNRAAAQIKVFEDSWRWDQSAAEAYQQTVEIGEQVSRALQAFRQFLGDSGMLAYLSMMAPRLVELRRVLKPTGSIYLHCDPTASHYLKMLMDAVFGVGNFLNEIIWYYRGAGVPKDARARRHDILLHYAKQAGKHYFDPDPIRRPYAPATVKRFSHYIGNVRGASDFGVQKLNPKGKHPDDVIIDIQPIAPSAKARLGYPTQKPEELLAEIVSASSNKGDVVLDPFCGCGTTIAVTQKLNRFWIGIDITHLAIGLIKHRLQDTFGNEISSTYQVIGEPTDLASAKTLANDDPYQFQWWALGLVGARPVEQKKGADQGIDGRLYFHDEANKTKQIILQVKGGHSSSAHVRDLRGVLDREKADIGVFITLQKPSKAMRREVAGADFYLSPWNNKRYPRLQILTIEELLKGKTIDYPAPQSTDTTFKKAPRFIKEKGEQKKLF